jgi:chemotaxis protein CheD
LTGAGQASCPPEPHRIGIGELRVATAPERLAVYGLGSCVVVFLHDPERGLGGLVHVLLPGPPPSRAGAEARTKYALPAVRALVQEIAADADARARLVAKLVGGASMFTTEAPAPGESIGERNLAAILAALEEMGIPVVARDVGGRFGRSLIADPATGLVQVWSLRSASRAL